MRNRMTSIARGGYSLLELLVYSAILGSVVTTGMSAFIASNRMFALTALTQDRLVQVRESRQDFLATVREAVDVLPAYKDIKTGKSSLVLQLTPDARGYPRYAVYMAQKRRGRLICFVFEHNGDGDHTGTARAFEGEYDDITFDVVRPSNGVAPIVTLSMRVRPQQGEVGADRLLHQYVASPRGAWGPIVGGDENAAS